MDSLEGPLFWENWLESTAFFGPNWGQRWYGFANRLGWAGKEAELALDLEWTNSGQRFGHSVVFRVVRAGSWRKRRKIGQKKGVLEWSEWKMWHMRSQLRHLWAELLDGFSIFTRKWNSYRKSSQFRHLSAELWDGMWKFTRKLNRFNCRAMSELMVCVHATE